MRYLLEMGSWLALAVGFMGAVAADVFCWREAYNAVEMGKQQAATATMSGANPAAAGAAAYTATGGYYAIAGAILTAGLAIAIVMYLKSGKEES